MDYHPHKVNETIFRGFLNENKELLTLNTLQNLFNETIENFSEKWILILDDQFNSDDFPVRATPSLYGHKYCILMDYVTKSIYKIGIPNPKDITSIEKRQKTIIIYKKQSLYSKDIDTVFQKYIKNNKSSYIVSDLKFILIHTFSVLFEQEKGRYYETMKRYYQPVKSQSDAKESKETIFEVDDVFLSYNIDEESMERDKESLFKKLKGLFKIQSVNRKDILFKNYSNQKLNLLINLSLDVLDLIKAINEYVRGDALIYLDWGTFETPRFQNFNSTLLKDFRDTTITKDNLKLVRERISDKIKEINEDASQFRELSDNQNKFSYFILRRKKQAGNGFKSFEFRSKEFLAKLKAKTKVIFSVTISQVRKFGNKCVQKCINLGRKTWFQILIGYIVLSALSGLFQAWFNKIIK